MTLSEALAIQTAYVNVLAKIQEMAPDVSPEFGLVLALVGGQTFTPAEIMRRKYYAGTNLTYGLKCLEKSGLIERCSASDRRKKPLILTTKGRWLADRIASAFAAEAKDAAA